MGSVVVKWLSKKKKEKALIFTLADFHGVNISTIADFKLSSDVTEPVGILRPSRAQCRAANRNKLFILSYRLDVKCFPKSC